MNAAVKQADPLSHPLTGSSLVESSAGTGKTTLLVRLYLRALLLEGLNLDQILAVTYTRAATGELSVKIRRALLEAQRNVDEPSGAFWEKFFADRDKGELHKRIRAALAAFDDKGVFTIHGFCQRMLADNAFEAGTLFASEELEDDDALKREIAADFWRRRVGTGSPCFVRWFVATFKSPKALLDDILDKALQVSGPLDITPVTDDAAVEAADHAFAQAVKTARETWAGEGGRVTEILQNARNNGLNGNSFRQATVDTLLSEWDQWLVSAPTLALPGKFELMTARVLEEKTRKHEQTPASPFFDAAEVLAQAAEALSEAWWQQTAAAAFEFIRGEMRRRKRRQRERGFDDMLREFRDALDGGGGEALARRIAGQYPLILVDEFQDTDPLQYEIFSRIHRAGGKRHGLVLIGDPKQAIYRFRGADIETYLRAREDCKGRIYGLTENYRSAPEMLDALNALFGKAEDPFVGKAIPYRTVTTGHEPPIEPLKTDGNDEPTVVIDADTDGETLAKGDARYLATRVCADEIARLVRLAREGSARLGDKPVQPGDIAVLVNQNDQGLVMQAALRERGVSSAMVATRSVFASKEAEALECLLAAVAEPTRGSLLRRALVTRLFGVTAAELLAWQRDENRWADIVERFREYYRMWQAQGITIMLAKLFRGERVIERTLARSDGERAMTNLRHLAELIGAEAVHRPGMVPLLAWFAQERIEQVKQETRQLRLESDEDLVRIATIHKAKGLQYPVVFLPFLWDGKCPTTDKPPRVIAHDADKRAVLDLGSPELEARQAEARRDADAEAARKTYVALTRAVHACFIVAVRANGAEKSAFGRFLGVAEAKELSAGIRGWVESANGVVSARAPAAGKKAGTAPLERRYGEARRFEHPERLQRRFHVASYSLLASGARDAAVEEPEHDEAVPVPARDESATGVHAFPAGAASGIFMHGLIETLPFDASGEDIGRAVREQLRARGFEAERWADVLTRWLQGVFTTPLDAPGCRLADIGNGHRVDEMEFRFALEHIEAAALDEAVAGFAPGLPGPRLDFEALAGQMKGYLDLTFEHDGRVWVVDYKSNRLGNDLAAYTTGALDRAMAEHRYDLQYLLYTVAVHRYLEARLPDYDYDKHFGGVLYLFLRGMAPDAPAPRGVWHTRPARADIERLDAYLAGAESWS